MAKYAELLHTMPPSQTNQCGHLQSYGNAPTQAKPAHDVLSKIVEVATIQKLANFLSLRCN
jgi:hypothetical protein